MIPPLNETPMARPSLKLCIPSPIVIIQAKGVIPNITDSPWINLRSTGLSSPDSWSFFEIVLIELLFEFNDSCENEA